jgi:hypothetical protein
MNYQPSQYQRPQSPQQLYTQPQLSQQFQQFQYQQYQQQQQLQQLKEQQMQIQQQQLHMQQQRMQTAQIQLENPSQYRFLTQDGQAHVIYNAQQNGTTHKAAVNRNNQQSPNIALVNQPYPPQQLVSQSSNSSQYQNSTPPQKNQNQYYAQPQPQPQPQQQPPQHQEQPQQESFAPEVVPFQIQLQDHPVDIATVTNGTLASDPTNLDDWIESVLKGQV